MSRKLTASDRKSLIRLASELPKGSPERKAILAGLTKTSAKKLPGFPGLVWEDSRGYLEENGGVGPLSEMPPKFRRPLGPNFLVAMGDGGEERRFMRFLKKNGYRMDQKYSTPNTNDMDPITEFELYVNGEGSTIILDYNDYGSGLSISIDDPAWG